MNRGRTLSVALDTEFIRTHGQVLTSSVAFVPFAPACHTGLRPTTVFGESAVVSLHPTEVLRRADVLPCGHCLRPLLEMGLVTGETLKNIQSQHTKDMKAKFVERDAIASVASVPRGVDNVKQGAIIQNEHAFLPPIDSLCPYNIPNIRRTDEKWLQEIFTAPADSTQFHEAAKNLSYLRAYGKGKRHRPAFSFLMWHYPNFLQKILQTSFSDATEWCAWLTNCGNVVEKELCRVAECHHRASSSPPLPSSSLHLSDESAEAVQGTANAGMGCSFVECHSLEEMSYELNRRWSTLLYQRKGGTTKFYTYGDMDAKAIHNTLQLSCCSAKHYSQRARRAGEIFSAAQKIQRDGQSTTTTPSIKLTSDSADLLFSPFQAQAVDITRHPLFAASGFCASTRAIPSLLDALKKTAHKNTNASELCAHEDPHNPVWDAKALACISVSCGIG